MSTLAPLLEALFTERLIGQRNASPHTIAAYRDTYCQLLRYTAQATGHTPERLALTDLDAPTIGAFLHHLETERHVSVRTRNLRLTAVRVLFQFAAYRHPEHAALIQRVLAIPPKRTVKNLVTYLTEPETTALLAAPDRHTQIGRRDHDERSHWFRSLSGSSHIGLHVRSVPHIHHAHTKVALFYERVLFT